MNEPEAKDRPDSAYGKINFLPKIPHSIIGGVEGLFFTTLFLAATITLAWFYLDEIEKQTRKSTGDTLQSVLTITQQAAHIRMGNLGKEASLIASSEMLTEMVEKQLLLPRDKLSLLKSEGLEKIRKHLENKFKQQGSRGFFIIAPDGISVASRRDQNIGMKNLIAEQRPELLQRVFQGKSQFIPPVSSDVPLPDMRGKLVEGLPTTFVAAPIIDSAGKIIAAFAFRIDPALDSNPVMRLGRTGDSGETYAFDKDGNLLTDSRFIKDLLSIGLLHDGHEEKHSFILRNPGGDLTKGFVPKISRGAMPLTFMAESATAGNRGISVVGHRDYRGVPVFSAWLWDKDLGIGIASEIDEDEALKTYLATRNITIIVISLISGLAVILAVSLVFIEKKSARFIAKSEERLKNAQEIAHVGAWDWNIVTGKIEWTDETYRIFGFKPQQFTPTYERFLAQIYPDDREKVSTAISEAVSGVKNYDIEHQIVLPDASVRDVHEKGEVYRDWNHVPHRMVGVVLDVTERRRIEKEVESAYSQAIEAADKLNESLLISEELRDQAIEATNAKSDFLASMSHEIRTPMNAIMGMAELLADTRLTAEQKKYVDVFSDATETLLQVINDILDVSKVEAGKIELEKNPFALDELARSVMAIFAPSAQEKGLEIVYRIKKETPTALKGDPTRLRQVLGNLLGNAIKFTKSGEIVFAIEPKGEEPGHLCFSVSDTGIGVPEEQRETIFDRFTQADASTTRTYGGTGLGLTICRRLIDLMGGRIWVEENRGGGSVFLFTARFEILKEVEPEGLARSGSHDDIKPTPAVKIEKELAILLVEDTANNVMLFEALIKKIAPLAKIDVARNGKVGIDKFRANSYDIVFMDMEMPIMDGYDATKAIRKIEKGLNRDPAQVIALTAHALDEYIERSLQAGCDDHLPKPLKKNALADMIILHTNKA